MSMIPWWPFRRRKSPLRSQTRAAGRRLRFDTLEDRWAPANLTVANVSILEGDTGQRDLVFDLRLGNAEADEVRVTWQTADGSATAGVDYVAGNGVAVFAPGEISKTIVVAINGDTDVEPDETLTLTLSSPVGVVGLPANPAATGTIRNDDGVVAVPAPAPAPAQPQGALGPNRTNTSFAAAIELAPPDARLESTPIDKWQRIKSEASSTAGSFFKISMGVPFGLAVDVVKGTGAAGIALDLYNANQQLIYTTVNLAANSYAADFSFGSDEAKPTNVSLYRDLPAGTYFLKARTFFRSNDFSLSILTDSAYTTTVPVLESLPGAPVSVLLDFDGHRSDPLDYWVQVGFTPSYSFPAINLRGLGHVGDANTFSPAERLYMANTWREVAEDYSPFNINVTTKETPLVQNGVPLGQRAVVINSDQRAPWLPVSAGAGPLNGMSLFPGGATSFSYAPTVLQDRPFHQNASILVGVGGTVSHEVGHVFGLEHQWGLKTNVVDVTTGQATLGIGLVAITAGGSRYKGNDQANTFVVGMNTPHSKTTPASLQSDLAVVSRAANRTGFRPDEAGATIAAATPLAAAGNGYRRSGVISQSDDVDMFSFVASGRTTIDVEVGSFVADPGLISAIELFDANGASVARGTKKAGDRAVANLHATLSTRLGEKDGQVTLGAGHGLAVGDMIALSWGQAGRVVSRFEVRVAGVAGNVITIEDGEGEPLPARNSQIVVVKPLPAGRSSISQDLTAGTYYLKVTGTGRRATDDPQTFIENVGQYSIDIATAATPPGQPANQPPVVTLPGGGVTVQAKAAAVLVDGAATIKDPTSPDFNGGRLVVTLTGGTADDRLAIRADNVVELAPGGAVHVNGKLVGTLVVGDAANTGFPLVVTFTTDDATPAAAQEILRRVTFANETATVNVGAARTLSVVARDRQGADSTAVTKTITVTAPLVEKLKLVDNLGLTVGIDAPKQIGTAELKSTTPDGPLGPQTITYKITQIPRNGALLLALPTDAPETPNFLPIEMAVGDTFTQNQLDNGAVAYRLTPGSAATSDQFAFTATDGTDTIPDTIFAIRVTRAAAPVAGNPAAPIGIQEGFETFAIEASPDLYAVIDDSPIETVIGPSRLSYVADDPRDLVYEIVDGPEFGTLNLDEFSQQTINDNGLVYTSPLVAALPAGVSTDRFTYVVRDLTTGGVSEPVEFLIGFENPNDAPEFAPGTELVELEPIQPFGPHETVFRVQDLLVGRFLDPDYVPGQAHGFGIAITGADDANGEWDYSTDAGATWTNLPEDLSPTSALLLSGYTTATSLRFRADPDFVGSSELAFRLWDETNDVNPGDRANVNANETSSFSFATGRAVVQVAAEAREPSFFGGEPVTVLEDAGEVVVLGWATSIESDRVTPVTFEITAGDDPLDVPLVFVTPPTIDAAGTLRFQLAPNQNGTAEFEVRITSPVGDSVPAPLVITATAINDAPTITLGPDLRVGAGAGFVASAAWAKNIAAGPANEASQTLSLRVTSDNPGLFSVAPNIDLATGTLTFAPNPSAGGTAQVVVTLGDDGGTANGGAKETVRTFRIDVTPVLPGPATNAKFVRNVYLDLLGREPDAGGYLAWTTAMANGLPREAVVRAIYASAEYATIQIANFFRTLLRREPDASGLGSFVAAIQAGTSLDQVKAAILASQEYFVTQGGGTNAGFVTALYRDTLGRTATTTEAQPMIALLDAGGSRAALAGSFLGSVEYDQIWVRDAFRRYLGRDADADGLNAFVAALQAGMSEAAAIATLLASAEYDLQP